MAGDRGKKQRGQRSHRIGVELHGRWGGPPPLLSLISQGPRPHRPATTSQPFFSAITDSPGCGDGSVAEIVVNWPAAPSGGATISICASVRGHGA